MPVAATKKGKKVATETTATEALAPVVETPEPVAAKKATAKKAAKKVAKKTAPKPAEAPAAVEPTPEPAAEPQAPQTEAAAPRKGTGAKVYAVMVDQQNVPYLRVAQQGKDTLFVVNTGSKKVDLITMDAATFKSRDIQPVADASVLEAAKVLAKPLTSGIIVSDRAKKYLDEILNDKELLMTTKKQGTAKAASGKSTAGKKPSAPRAPRANAVDQTVTFKKSAKDGDLPKQAAEVLSLIQKAKSLKVSELLQKMDGVIQTKQTMAIIWSFYRNRLVKEGYVTLA